MRHCSVRNPPVRGRQVKKTAPLCGRGEFMTVCASGRPPERIFKASHALFSTAPTSTHTRLRHSGCSAFTPKFYGHTLWPCISNSHSRTRDLTFGHSHGSSGSSKPFSNPIIPRHSRRTPLPNVQSTNQCSCIHSPSVCVSEAAKSHAH